MATPLVTLDHYQDKCFEHRNGIMSGTGDAFCDGFDPTFGADHVGHHIALRASGSESAVPQTHIQEIALGYGMQWLSMKTGPSPQQLAAEGGE